MRHEGLGRWVAALGLAVVMLCAAVSAWAVPQDFISFEKTLKLRRLSTDAFAETLTITTVADTIRSQWIDTSDWDWGAFGSLPGTATTSIVAQVFIRPAVVSATMATGVQAGSDTIYYTIEKQARRDSTAASGALTAVSGNRTIVAAVGAIALPEGGLEKEPLFIGQLIVDGDTRAANNIWMCPKFRLRLAGDTAAFKMAGARLSIVYPRRAAAQ